MLWSSGVKGLLRGCAEQEFAESNLVLIALYKDVVQTDCKYGSLNTVHLEIAAREGKGCQSYRVKPHEQLVLVSLTHYCASTPSLSTSWS